MKPLSTSYKALQPSIHEGLDKLLFLRRGEVPELDSKDWEDIWEYPMQQLVSARDRLIYSPKRIFPSHPSKCWRCLEDARFLHVFWYCPVIRFLWADVSRCIRSVMTIAEPLSIDVCMLGLVHLLATFRAMRTLIGLLLFYARKAILLKWKSPQAPTSDFWKSILNKTVPLYKFTFESGGFPQ